jgi:acetolactate synthase-1/2/3 large subunit
VDPAALTAEATREIATALAGAERPLIIASYLGRNPDAVPALVDLAELLAIPVLESAAFHVNFPGDHPLHAGYQFTTSAQNETLAAADVILVLDSDVPWIPDHVARAREAYRGGRHEGGGIAAGQLRSG